MALRDGTCGVPARVCDQTMEQYTRMREETMNKRTISAKSFRLVESFLVRSLTAVLRAIAKPTSLAFTPARRPQTFQTLDSGRASTHYLRVSRLLAISAGVNLLLLRRRLLLDSFLPCPAGSNATAGVAFVTFSLRVAAGKTTRVPSLPRRSTSN